MHPPRRGSFPTRATIEQGAINFMKNTPQAGIHQHISSTLTNDVCLDLEQHKWRTIITLIHQPVLLTRQSRLEKLISLTETLTALCEARGTTNSSPSSPPSTNEQRI
ncbi:unnamed protein product [Brassica rapa]|uniref:Uncharacterized protein n=1 Tax=Brassica campestris TaxID=3711 RepID=A0A3P6BA71_BRACM|nr:unnamed protein product [Brassica rapa]VDC96124.1 unnamed protein product [Brassica rapa]